MSPHSFSRRPERVPERTVKIGPRQSQPSWPNKIGQKENFNLGINVGNPEYLARSGSQSEWRIRFILLARGFSHVRRILIDLVTCLLMFVHYLTGLTAFDFISDFEEWIECGYFNEEIKARLKGKPSIHERLSLEKPVTKLSALVSYFFIISMCHYWVVYVGAANGKRQGRVRRISVSFLGAECFLPSAQHPCKFIRTKEFS